MQQTFLDFLKECFTPYKKQVYILGSVNEGVAKILNRLGIDSFDYKHVIDRYGIRHALIKHSKDEFPITEQDLLKIPEIISRYDTIAYSGKSRLKLDSILYSKRFNGTTIYIEEVRTGRKQLVFKTMYKKRTEPSASTANHPEGVLTHTSADKSVPTLGYSETNIV